MKKVLLLVLIWLPALGHAAASAWIPFENRDGHIAIEIKIGGKPATAILDSGAEVNGVSMDFLEANPDAYSKGRRITVSGAFGDMDTHMANNLQLELFGVPLEVDRVVPMQLSTIDFVIGLRFFENFIVQIDYPSSKVRIVEHESINMRDVANVRMKRGSGSVQTVVEVDMNGEYDAWLMLDTGNNGGMLLPRSVAVDKGWLERLGSVRQDWEGATTTAQFETLILPEFTIGPYTLENVRVSVPVAGQDTNIAEPTNRDRNTGTRIDRSEQSDGILGYDVLKHFVLTIDYKRKLLHIGTPE